MGRGGSPPMGRGGMPPPPIGDGGRPIGRGGILPIPGDFGGGLMGDAFESFVSFPLAAHGSYFSLPIKAPSHFD